MKNFLFIGLGRRIDLKIEDYTPGDKLFLRLNEKWLSDEEWKIWACDPKHYSEKDLQKIQKSNWIDYFLQKDICETWDDVPLFDEWNCTSVLEHVNRDKCESFFDGLVSKIKPDSVGHIHIDLSDHQTETQDLFKDPDYASHYHDREGGKYSLYLNRITEDQWFNLIDRYFTYHKVSYHKKHRIHLIDVKKKSFF